jgi:hypothetical protein
VLISESIEKFCEDIMLKLGSSRPVSIFPRPAPKPKIWDLPGFSGKSRVATSFGHLPIEGLRLRDPLRTISGKYLKVQWIDKIHLDPDFLSRHPEALPVKISKASLGQMTPNRDVLVSPEQVLRLPRHIGQMRDRTAHSIVGHGRVLYRPSGDFTYYLFHCGEPTSVSIDGLWFEISPNCSTLVRGGQAAGEHAASAPNLATVNLILDRFPLSGRVLYNSPPYFVQIAEYRSIQGLVSRPELYNSGCLFVQFGLIFALSCHLTRRSRSG